MEIREKAVLKDTILTEREVLRSNFAANIVAIAAVGALVDITEETSIIPLTPQTYITPRVKSGNKNSLMKIAYKHLKFFIPSISLLCAK